jgi:hypothetical protein
MLIRIDRKGMKKVRSKTTKRVKCQMRWYYVGENMRVPVILVVCGKRPQVGEVWEAKSGNETGYPGFCNGAHLGKKIGKLTLHTLCDAGDLPDDAQVLTLSYQIRRFEEQFLPLKQGKRRKPR